MSCKNFYKEGDRVGLFYSHTPERSLFFGWATFQGDRRVPDISELRPPGELKTSMGAPGPLVVGSEVQGRFVLEEEPHEILWEEEVWHSPEDRCHKLLAGDTPVFHITKDMVREVWRQWEKEGITHNGYTRIDINFKGVTLDSTELEDRLKDAVQAVLNEVSPGLSNDAVGISIDTKSFWDDEPVPSLADRLVQMARRTDSEDPT
jgi:hypothetical protein